MPGDVAVPWLKVRSVSKTWPQFLRSPPRIHPTYKTPSSGTKLVQGSGQTPERTQSPDPPLKYETHIKQSVPCCWVLLLLGPSGKGPCLEGKVQNSKGVAEESVADEVGKGPAHQREILQDVTLNSVSATPHCRKRAT